MERESGGAALPARMPEPIRGDPKERVVEFVRTASLEITPHDQASVAELTGLVPPGTAVYVTHTPKASVRDVADTACHVESLGFRAFPHLVARRIASEAALDAALRRLRDHGVTRAMLVAGDLSTPAGIYSGTLDILESGRLVAAGIDTLGVAGHPEGHKRIGSTLLWQSLRQKQEYGEQTGARIHIVSQFGFDPGALVEWERQLTEHGIALPVHVGIAGPASLKTLIKYAMLCGIGASLNALMANLSALSTARHLVTSADEMLLAVVRAREGALARRIVQPHFFSFGGMRETARWLLALREGRFAIDEKAGTLIVPA